MRKGHHILSFYQAFGILLAGFLTIFPLGTNDSAYFTSGNQPTPLEEIDIAIKAELNMIKE